MSDPDLNSSAQLIPKLKMGCEQWLEKNILSTGFDPMQLVK